jgi:hypothetical protein
MATPRARKVFFRKCLLFTISITSDVFYRQFVQDCCFDHKRKYFIHMHYRYVILYDFIKNIYTTYKHL